MKKSIILSVIATISIVGMQTGVAGAWYYNMSGSGACQADGSYKITWKVNNTSEPTQLEVKKSSNTSIVNVGETIPARQIENFYQVVNGTKPGTYTLELTADWKEDRNNMKRSATVKLDKACEQPKPEEPEVPVVPETPVTPEVPSGGGGGQVLSQVTVVPKGPVNAGEGSSVADSFAALFSILTAATVAVYSGLRIVRR